MPTTTTVPVTIESCPDGPIGVSRAIVRYNIGRSVIYYDLTAFIMRGEHGGSDLAKYGFAHNTPADKKKVNESLDAATEGHIPMDYRASPGIKTDKATVEENMQCLAALLKKHGRPLQQMLVVGDRAMLDDKLALLHDNRGLRYLADWRRERKYTVRYLN